MAHTQISFVSIADAEFLLDIIDIAEFLMSDSSFCSFAFDLRLYCFLDWFSFLCSYEPLFPTFFFSPFHCSGSVMHMESLILLGGHLMFVLCYLDYI